MANLTTAATGFPASLDTYSTQAANNRILSSHYNGALGAIVALETTIGITKTLGSVLFAGASGNYAEDNTNLFWDDTNNQLQLAATGSAAGLLIGGDVQLYRSAANVLRTPDSLTVDGSLIVTSNTTLTGAIISNLIFTDATYDIGASGATRPRDLFLSRNAIFGGTLSITGLLTVNSGNIRLTNSQGLEWGGSTNFIVGNNTSNFIHFYTNDTQRVLIGSTGIVSIGTTATTGQLVVDQTSTTAAIEVVTLEQRDVDQPFIHFATTIGTGNAIEAVAAKTLTTTHFLMVDIDGVGTRYIPMGTIA